MTVDWLPASVVDDGHLGWWVKTPPMRAPARLLSVDHGGPFPVPAELADVRLPDYLAHLAEARLLPPHFTTQLRVDPGDDPPFYVWLVPEARVHLAHPDTDLAEFSS